MIRSAPNRVPGLVVGGTGSNAGKTVTTLALLCALQARGLRVHAAKTGPDFIDTAFHAALTGAPAANLDVWMCRASRPNRAGGPLRRIPQGLARIFARMRAPGMDGRAPDILLVEGAMGHEENEKPRMVKSPWFEEEIPFDLAAETGTRKVIRDHSTIGIVVTTDGTISEIPRENYLPAEQRVVEELEALGKPFVILLNSTHPDAPETKQLAEGMARDYDHTVLPVSCVDLDAEALGSILRQVLYEFPVQELDFALPRWVTMLENGHWLQTQVYDAAMQLAAKVSRMKDVPSGTDAPALECDAVQRSAISGIDLANGSVRITEGIVRVTVLLKPDVFYRVLSEQTGLAIGDEAGLMPCIMELAKAKREYEKVRSALEQVEATGYGIVMPTVSELKLEQPQIVRQGTNYGVRLEACAPSIQMMKATIHTEISPIVGTEKQSEDLVQSLLGDFESDPERLWESNIFGKSLHELVNEGLQNKLLHMPQEARGRLQDTLEKVINDGCSGVQTAYCDRNLPNR